MSFTVRTIAAPSQEPVSLADLRDFLRIDIGDTSNDSLLTGLLSSARTWAEQYTRRRFMRQTIEYLQDFFPGLAQYGGYPAGLITGSAGDQFFYQKLAFHLPYSPVQSVTSVTFTSQSGAVTTLDPATYICDLISNPARITPLFGQTWPPLTFVPNAVAVTYQAGYAQALTVSMTAASAILTGYAATIADVGSPITVPGAGPNGSSLNALVASVASSVATLNTVASNAVNSVAAVLGLPSGIRTAIMALAAVYFENATYVGAEVNPIAPPFVVALLYPFRDMSRV
jgi:hypothetical protein